jgi:hypothetical protein
LSDLGVEQVGGLEGEKGLERAPTAPAEFIFKLLIMDGIAAPRDCLRVMAGWKISGQGPYCKNQQI